jgi:hypothetical protein
MDILIDARAYHKANIISYPRLITMGNSDVANELSQMHKTR